MEKRAQRQAWKALQDEIRAVLLQEWDPIGVKDVPEAADEYDGYIAGISALLRAGATDEQIAHHLSEIETKEMGLRPAAQRSYAPLIGKLRSLIRE